MNKKELAYVYYPDNNGSLAWGKNYGHPELRVFEIARYSEEKGKIYLGDCLLTIKGQTTLDGTGHTIWPYGIRCAIDIMSYKAETSLKLATLINKSRHRRSNYLKSILHVIQKKAVRLINTGWINPGLSCNESQWVPYSDRANY